MEFEPSVSSQTETCVDTVRVLHQTIVSLRAALEQSRREVIALKAKNHPGGGDTNTCERQIITGNDVSCGDLNSNENENNLTDKPFTVKHKRRKHENKRNEPESKATSEFCGKSSNTDQFKSLKPWKGKSKSRRKFCDNTEDVNKFSKSVENLSNVQSLNFTKSLCKSKTVIFSNVYNGERQICTSNSLRLVNSSKVKREQKTCVSEKENKKKQAKSESKDIEKKLTSDVFKSKNNGRLSSHEQIDQTNLKVEEKSINETLTTTSCDTKTDLNRLNQSVTSEHVTEEGIPKDTQNLSVKTENNSGNQFQNAEVINKEDLCYEEEYRFEQINRTKHFEEGKDVHVDSQIDLPSVKNTQEQFSLDFAGKCTINTDFKEVDQCLQDDKEKVTPLVSAEKNLLSVASTKEDQELKLIEIVESVSESPKFVSQPTDLRTNSNVAVGNVASCGETKEKTLNGNVSSTTEDNTKRKNCVVSESSTTEEDKSKNLELSVKIFKDPKKFIEVDIHTKKSGKNKRKKRSSRKMADKSQNTSFEAEQIPPVTHETDNQVNIKVISPRNLQESSGNTIEGILPNDIEQEVDDIELIFTTDDTKDTDFKEELVPIEPYLLQCPLSDYDEKLSTEASDRELEDDVFNDNFENENQENCNFQSQSFHFRRDDSQIYNSKSDNSINQEQKSLKSYYSFQDSSFENKSLEKDESFDRFDEKAGIIETDISKIGIHDVEYNTGRRNTCPNPLQYRPIMHREALGRGLSSRKCRPILAHSNVARKESEAQTDISAIPRSSWRSESSLGHKVKIGENFTTLPSKFPHPGSRLRLSEKTVEARRVLLSDIGFTSMVPELSRSADHLYPTNVRPPNVCSYGQFLKTTDLYSPAYMSQKCVWNTVTPSEYSHFQSRYSSQYPFHSPPMSTRRCSAPVSPSRKSATLKSTPSRVRFANGSLPELRGDWTTTVDSGDSTDSLVDEAEHFLRRSIDCLAPCRDVCYRSEKQKQTNVRRASAPEPSRDNVPPAGWQPFLPRVPRDLHLDYWVKVISSEGRVKGGRVRYVGPLMSQTDQFVGVQLSTPDGHSDGTYNNRRYFNCEPYHGIFVPFKKIIMGWKP